MPQFNPYAQYQELSVTTQSPGALVVTVYDALIRSLKEAKRAIKENDFTSRSRSFDLAFELLSELRKSLNHEKGAEISKGLEALYAFFSREILMANASNDGDRLDPIVDNLVMLRDAWETARREAASA